MSIIEPQPLGEPWLLTLDNFDTNAAANVWKETRSFHKRIDGVMDANRFEITRPQFIKEVGAAIVTGRVPATVSIVGIGPVPTVLALSPVELIATRHGTYVAECFETPVLGTGVADWCYLHLRTRAWGFKIGEDVKLSSPYLKSGDMIRWGQFIMTISA